MSKELMISEILKGITTGLVAGMEMQQRKQKEQKELSLKEQQLELERQKAPVTFPQYKAMPKEERELYGEFEKAGKFEPLVRPPSQQIPRLSSSLQKELSDFKLDVDNGIIGTQRVNRWITEIEKNPKSQATGVFNKLEIAIKNKVGTLNPQEASARVEVARLVNDTIKRISGAAVSEQEAVRLAQQLPDIRQNPKAFRAVWNQIMSDRYNTYHSKVNDYYGTGTPGLETHMQNLNKYSKWAKQIGWKSSSEYMTEQPIKTTGFPRTVSNGTHTATVSNEQELAEATKEGFK